jgi:hypothetical protein
MLCNATTVAFHIHRWVEEWWMIFFLQLLEPPQKLL